jgi:hypothetical protein
MPTAAGYMALHSEYPLEKVNHIVLAQQNVCRLGFFTQDTEAGKTLNKGHYLPFLI